MSDRIQRVVILGAAGRDFHDFNVYWKNDPGIEIVAFTAAQIPDIAGRIYPPRWARYDLREHEPGTLSEVVAEVLKMHTCA